MTQMQWLEQRVAFCQERLLEISEERRHVNKMEILYQLQMRKWERAIEMLTPDAAEIVI
jgi:hypothetical protein